MSDSKWTQLVLQFFEQQAVEEHWLVENNYMFVDQVWRGKAREIVLALEHENKERNVDRLLNKEVAHLIDLRAHMKVGIFYPTAGDEAALVKEIRLRIATAAANVPIPGEQYMFILGSPTWKQGKQAIQFKASVLDQRGNVTVAREQVILQGRKSQSNRL